MCLAYALLRDLMLACRCWTTAWCSGTFRSQPPSTQSDEQSIRGGGLRFTLARQQRASLRRASSAPCPESPTCGDRSRGVDGTTRASSPPCRRRGARVQQISRVVEVGPPHARVHRASAAGRTCGGSFMSARTSTTRSSTASSGSPPRTRSKRPFRGAWRGGRDDAYRFNTSNSHLQALVAVCIASRGGFGRRRAAAHAARAWQSCSTAWWGWSRGGRRRRRRRSVRARHGHAAADLLGAGGAHRRRLRLAVGAAERGHRDGVTRRGGAAGWRTRPILRGGRWRPDSDGGAAHEEGRAAARFRRHGGGIAPAVRKAPSAGAIERARSAVKRDSGGLARCGAAAAGAPSGSERVNVGDFFGGEFCGISATVPNAAALAPALPLNELFWQRERPSGVLQLEAWMMHGAGHR